MLETVLRTLGRWLLIALRVLIWEPITEIVRGAARGVSDAVRRSMPLVLGAVILWGILAFAPELFRMILVILIMIFGLKVMMKGVFPPAKAKKK